MRSTNERTDRWTDRRTDGPCIWSELVCLSVFRQDTRWHLSTTSTVMRFLMTDIPTLSFPPSYFQIQLNFWKVPKDNIFYYFCFFWIYIFYFFLFRMFLSSLSISRLVSFPFYGVPYFHSFFSFIFLPIYQFFPLACFSVHSLIYLKPWRCVPSKLPSGLPMEKVLSKK